MTNRKRKKLFGENDNFNYLEYDKEKARKTKRLRKILFIAITIGLAVFAMIIRSIVGKELAIYLMIILYYIFGTGSINKEDCIEQCKECYGSDFERYRIGYEWYSKCKQSVRFNIR